MNPQVNMIALLSALCHWPFAIGAFRLRRRLLCLVALAAALPCALVPSYGAQPEAPAAKERQFISVLKTNAPPAEQALACKHLAIYGSQEAVPALAPLLADPQLASWARIALEAIPDPACDAALREAMGKLQGKLLVGVINSLGARRDAQSTSGLIKQLKNTDPEVASAAAVALGRIGGAKAAKALSQALPKASPNLRSAVAEGCIRCAESFLIQSNAAQAVKLYDTVRKADVPTQRMLEATRGAILARQSAGLPLLLEQLRAPDKARFNIGLRTARELPGREVTQALVAELSRCRSDRQPYLLLALGDRQDEAVLPAVLHIAASSPAPLRVVAVNLLDRLGNVSSVPVLLDAATSPEAELAAAAQAVLARLPGTDVEADLLNRLPTAKAKLQQVLIQVSVQRHLERALPLIAAAVASSDLGVRASAVQALGTLGDTDEAGFLVALLSRPQSTSVQERGDIEAALIAISARKGAACASVLLPLTRSNDSALRTLALHVLASAGGPEALAAVKAAVNDSEETVQDEAVRALSTWPSNWPEDAGAAEPLLSLAKSGKKPSYQVLGLRGYLQLIQGDKQLKPEEKVARLKELLPLLQRPEEKRQTITILEANPTVGALELLLPFAAESAVAEDACSALVKLADRPGVSAAQRQQALQSVTEHSKNEARKKKAQELLKVSAKQS
jgi:HEAT repeat protein